MLTARKASAPTQTRAKALRRAMFSLLPGRISNGLRRGCCSWCASFDLEARSVGVEHRLRVHGAGGADAVDAPQVVAVGIGGAEGGCEPVEDGVDVRDLRPQLAEDGGAV